MAVSPDAALFERWGDGDEAARGELVTRHMPLARRLAAHYHRGPESQDDLRQVAYVGLLDALERYQPERGEFVAFAIPTIRGALRHYFRDHGWALHVPHAQKDRYLAVRDAIERLATTGEHSPSPRQIADATGMTVERVLDAIQAGEAFQTTTMNAPGAASASADDPALAAVEFEAIMTPAFAALSPRARLVIWLRFVEGLKLAEIARRLGISQMRVSQLLRRALGSLGEALDDRSFGQEV